MEVNGADLNVRMEGVLFEKNSASGATSQMKMTRQAFVLKVLNCLLQSNDVPFLPDVGFRWRLLCLVEFQFRMLRGVSAQANGGAHR